MPNGGYHYAQCSTKQLLKDREDAQGELNLCLFALDNGVTHLSNGESIAYRKQMYESKIDKINSELARRKK